MALTPPPLLPWNKFSSITIIHRREDSHIKSDGNARRKIQIKYLRETNVGVTQA